MRMWLVSMVCSDPRHSFGIISLLFSGYTLSLAGRVFGEHRGCGGYQMLQKTLRGHALRSAHPGRRNLPRDRPWNEGHQKGRKIHDADPEPVPAGKYRTLTLIPFEIK